MKIHPKLTDFTKAKNIKLFHKLLEGIEEDLSSVDCAEFDVDILSGEAHRSFLARAFLGPDMKEAEETMIVSAIVSGCPVMIVIPIAAWRTELPYAVIVEFPVSIAGQAEYRRGTFGCKWHYQPEDKQRESELKHLLPKTEMNQIHTRMGYSAQGGQAMTPVQTRLQYEIQVGQALEPTADGRTQWKVHSGYEGGMFSGGSRPRIRQYLAAIPKVEALLRQWGGSSIPVDLKEAVTLR